VGGGGGWGGGGGGGGVEVTSQARKSSACWRSANTVGACGELSTGHASYSASWAG